MGANKRTLCVEVIVILPMAQCAVVHCAMCVRNFLLFFRGEEDPKKRQKRSNQGISESILSKDQLYEMFQTVLGIKKFEHQLIFNAAQVRYRNVTHIIDAGIFGFFCFF